MYFDEEPQQLPIGSFAKGNPVSLGEIWESSRHAQEKLYNDHAVADQLDAEYNQRIDSVRGVTKLDLTNPTGALSADEFTELGEATKQGQPIVGWDNIAKWRQERFNRKLKDLATEWPDHASIIDADRPPSLIVEERLRPYFEHEQDMAARAGIDSLSGMFAHLPSTLAGVGGSIHGWFRTPTAENPSPLATYTHPLTSLIGGASGKAVSLLKAAVRNAVANAAGQAAIEPLQQQQLRTIGIEYGTEQTLRNIATAGILGGVLDVGIRAPFRAGRAALGDREIGGLYRDYAPENPITTAPPDGAPLPDIPADLAERAKTGDAEAMAEATRLVGDRPAQGSNADLVSKALDGDLQATRTVGEALGLMEDPTFRGALEIAEVDAEMSTRLREMGVDDGEGLRALIQALKADAEEVPYPTLMPRPVDDPSVRLRADEAGALMSERSAELARLQQALAPELASVDPRLAQYIDAAIASGIEDILPPVRAALDLIADGVDTANVARALAKQVSDIVAKIGPDDFALQAIVHGGRGSPIDAARLIRAGAKVDRGMPLATEFMHTARALATMSDAAFDMVERGEVTPPVAAVVAAHVGDKTLQAGVIDDLKAAGIADPEVALDVLPDLLPSNARAVNSVLMGLRPDPRTDEMPLRAGAEVDEPSGAAAKKQVERLEKELGPEIQQATALAAQPVQNAVLTPAHAVVRAREIHEAIAQVADMVPEGVTVRTFSSVDDLPADLQASVIRANGVAFADALQRLQTATSPEARATARADLDEIKAGRGIEALTQDSAIWIATYAANPKGRMAHEVVHALKTMGKLGPDEVRLLASRARQAGAFDVGREHLYRQELQGRGYTPEKIAEVLDEEGAAHLIEQRINGQTFGAGLNSIIDRVRRIIEMIGNALRLRGFRSTDDIIDAVLSGEVARRSGVETWMREQDISAIAVDSSRPISGITERGFDPGGESSGNTIVPSFEEILDVLPADKAGDPDSAVLLERIRNLGKRSWNDLTDGEKEALYRDLTGDADQPTLFAFAGPRARTADLRKLAKAEDMEGQGKERLAIWNETGWFRGVDGKWRFEMSDRYDLMMTDVGLRETGAYFNRSDAIRALLGGHNQRVEDAPLFSDLDYMRLGDIFSHTALYDAYENVPLISVDVDRTGGKGMLAWNVMSLGEHVLRRAASPKSAKDITYPTKVVMHEVQHVAQGEEGFARGGSPEEFALDPTSALLHLEMGIEEPIPHAEKVRRHLMYRRLAGEVESRLVERRLQMTPEERAARPPWLDYDTPEEKQIVRFSNSGSSMAAFDAATEHFQKISRTIAKASGDEPLFAMRGYGNSRVEAEARKLMTDVNDLETRMWKEGANATEVAAAINKKFGFTVDPAEMAAGRVWWRINKEIREDGERSFALEFDERIQSDDLSGAITRNWERIEDSRMQAGSESSRRTKAGPGRVLTDEEIASLESASPEVAAASRNRIAAAESTPLSDAQKKEVARLHKKGVKPNAISETLTEKAGAYVPLTGILAELERQGLVDANAKIAAEFAKGRKLAWTDDMRAVLKNDELSAEQAAKEISKLAGWDVPLERIYTKRYAERKAGALPASQQAARSVPITPEIQRLFTSKDVRSKTGDDLAAEIARLVGHEVHPDLPFKIRYKLRQKGIKVGEFKKQSDDLAAFLASKDVEGFTLEQLAEEASRRLKRDVTPANVAYMRTRMRQDGVELPEVRSRNVWPASASALLTSPETRTWSDRRLALEVSKLMGRVVTKKDVQTQRGRMRQSGLIEPAFRWTDEMLAFLTDSDIAELTSRQKADAINARFGANVTGTMVRNRLMANRRQGGDPQFAFAGASSPLADQGSLSRAKKMVSAGADQGHVWRETGWTLGGADGKWRFEIDDSAAKLRERDFYLHNDGGKVYQGEWSGKLGDVLEHPQLFRAYPELREMNVDLGFGEYYGTRGGAGPDGFTAHGTTKAEVLPVLLHEVQHWVQQKEGFEQGFSPKLLQEQQTVALAEVQEAIALAEASGQGHNSLPILKDAEKALKGSQAYLSMGWFGPSPPLARAYDNLAGEVEARNVMTRQPMSAAERKATPPWQTEDVPRGDQMSREQPIAVAFDGEDKVRAIVKQAMKAAPAEAREGTSAVEFNPDFVLKQIFDKGARETFLQFEKNLQGEVQAVARTARRISELRAKVMEERGASGPWDSKPAQSEAAKELAYLQQSIQQIGAYRLKTATGVRDMWAKIVEAGVDKPEFSMRSVDLEGLVDYKSRQNVPIIGKRRTEDEIRADIGREGAAKSAFRAVKEPYVERGMGLLREDPAYAKSDDVLLRGIVDNMISDVIDGVKPEFTGRGPDYEASYRRLLSAIGPDGERALRRGSFERQFPKRSEADPRFAVRDAGTGDDGNLTLFSYAGIDPDTMSAIAERISLAVSENMPVQGIADTLRIEILDRTGVEISQEQAEALARQAMATGSDNLETLTGFLSRAVEQEADDQGTVRRPDDDQPIADSAILATPLRDDMAALQRMQELHKLVEICPA